MIDMGQRGRNIRSGPSLLFPIRFRVPPLAPDRQCHTISAAAARQIISTTARASTAFFALVRRLKQNCGSVTITT